jgi:hypothetical protein
VLPGTTCLFDEWLTTSRKRSSRRWGITTTHETNGICSRRLGDRTWRSTPALKAEPELLWTWSLYKSGDDCKFSRLFRLVGLSEEEASKEETSSFSVLITRSFPKGRPSLGSKPNNRRESSIRSDGASRASVCRNIHLWK